MQEVAQLLGIGRATLWVLSKQDNFPVFHVGRQFLRWRVGWHWYLLALLLPSLIALLALFLWAGFAGQAPGQWFLVPTPLRLAFLALGPWGEELGWRGYALPALQQRWRALPASALVGVLWFGWHQWPLVTPADPSTLDVGGC